MEEYNLYKLKFSLKKPTICKMLNNPLIIHASLLVGKGSFMKHEISLTNSIHKAVVEDIDFARVNARNWFLDNKHVYTKVMVPIDDPQSVHKSYPLKIRMDRYIFRLTTFNYIHIRHAARDTLNNCRSEMLKEPTPKAAMTKGMTRYLGVKSIKGFILAEYKNRAGILYTYKRYPISAKADQTTRLNLEQMAAEQYDQWAIEEEGPRARTNFLPRSIYL